MNVLPNERLLREKVKSGSLDADDYRALASLLCETNRFDEALALLRASLRLHPPNLSRAALLTLLGWYVNDITGDTEEPLSLGEQAAALTEGLETIEALTVRAQAQSLIAECAWNTDSKRAAAAADSALSLLARVTDASSSHNITKMGELHLAAARLNMMLGRSEEAAMRCKEALHVAREPVELVLSLTELGVAYRNSGKLAEAREILAKAVKSSGVVPYVLVRPYYELGLVERDLGKLPEARAKLEKAFEIIDANPAIPRVYIPELLNAISAISYELRDFEGAAKANQALVNICPTSNPLYWRSLLWLAQCQWDLGQFEMARASAEQIVESALAPEADRACARNLSRRARLSVVESYYASKDYAACIREGKALLPEFAECDDSYLALLLLIGHSHLNLENKSSARKYYEAILDCPSVSPGYRTTAESCLTRIAKIRH